MMTSNNLKLARRGCCSIVALSALAVSAGAAAQYTGARGTPGASYGIPPALNTQQALADSPGDIAGLLDGFYASLGIGVGHTDNVGRVPSPLEQSDTFTAFLGALGYKTDVGRHQFAIDYNVYAERYQDFSNFDFTNQVVRGAFNFDITEKLKADVWARYGAVNELRGTSGTAITQVDPNKVDIWEVGADAVYGTYAARAMQIRLGVAAAEWRYQNNGQQPRDQDRNLAYGEIHYNVTAKSSLFLMGTIADIEYTDPSTTSSDSTETSVQVGGEWRATEKTRGRISVGKLDKDYDDPSIADQDTTTYTARVQWQPLTYTAVNLYGSRRFEESGALLSNDFVSTLWGISLDHSFADRWNAGAWYNFTNDDYDTGREDDYDDFGLRLSYFFRRWLSLDARYGHIERSSNVPLNNYEENYYGININLRYDRTSGL